jgi:hypothetical protein
MYYQSNFPHLPDIREKLEYSGTVHELFIDFKKSYDSVKRVVLYNSLLEFGIPKKLVRLSKMCLNETYNKVLAGKHLSDKWPKTERCSIVTALQFCA